MKDIAWVTCEEHKKIISSEQPVVRRLLADGLEVDPVVWDDNTVNWNDYRLVIIRSIWDYHLKIDRFISWLSYLVNIRAKVNNPLDVLYWNHHKFYLQDLESKGIPIISSEFHRQGDKLDLRDVIGRTGWDQLVLKPAISATAHKLIKVDKQTLEGQAEVIGNLANTNDLIIQQFRPEIHQSGEWSLVFFNKLFSHAVLKFPKEGDFRVQNDFGGSRQLVQPEENILAQVGSILNIIKDDLLYCRIDGIVIDGQFLLMEIELIEPELYLFTDEIRDKFVKAIRNSLRSNHILS